MSESTPLKFALLVCGKLTGKAYTFAGDYYDVYFKFIHDSLPKGQDISFVLDPYDVVNRMEYPNEDSGYDALILTGSAASAYENLEWINKLVDYIASVAKNTPNVKIIGICFGHQIVARALGGECVPNGGKWEIGPTPLQLTDIGKRLFEGIDTVNIQQMHQDHVPAVAPDCHLLASTVLSPNQGMVRFAPSLNDPSSYPQPSPLDPLPPIQILTIQGHPEFTEPIVTALIEQRSASGVIDAAAARDAETRRFWRNDGVPDIGKVIWEVLLGKK